MPSISRLTFLLRAGLLLCAAAAGLRAQPALEFVSLRPETNQELTLKLTAPAKSLFRVEQSANLTDWTSLFSAVSATTGTNQFTDAGAPYAGLRFYRAADHGPTDALTGDHLPTSDGDVVIRPINHASLVLGWQGKLIYVDPVGGSGRFTGIPKADLILVTHIHGDHYDAATISAVRRTNGIILAPAVVQAAMPTALKTNTIILANGAVTNLIGLQAEAVAMYNLTSAFHPKGVGNGYVLNIGGQRLYASGDTEDTPEMRALPAIDVAFVCMNLPFTMTVPKAASAVREFRPRIVYPYHFSESNTQQFKNLVGTDLGIEVRLRKWY